MWVQLWQNLDPNPNYEPNQGQLRQDSEAVMSQLCAVRDRLALGILQGGTRTGPPMTRALCVWRSSMALAMSQAAVRHSQSLRASMQREAADSAAQRGALEAELAQQRTALETKIAELEVKAGETMQWAVGATERCTQLEVGPL